MRRVLPELLFVFFFFFGLLASAYCPLLSNLFLSFFSAFPTIFCCCSARPLLAYRFLPALPLAVAALQLPRLPSLYPTPAPAYRYYRQIELRIENWVSIKLFHFNSLQNPLPLFISFFASSAQPSTLFLIPYSALPAQVNWLDLWQLFVVLYLSIDWLRNQFATFFHRSHSSPV